MSATLSSQPREPLTTLYTPKPMMPRAISATRPITMIGPQLRLPETLTGVMGLRPLPPVVFLAAVDPAFFAVGLPAGGLPWPLVLPTLTLDGTRSGPGVLMLIVPRRFVRMRKGGARVAAECESLPPIAWLGDSRQPCCHRSLSCSCRVRDPRARRHGSARDDGHGATAQPRARR